MVSLPLFLLGGASAWFVYAGERSRAEDRVRSQTWNMALVVDQQFARAETLLQTLGTSNSLAKGDLAGFRSEALAASAVFDNAPISLMAADDRAVLNTLCDRNHLCSQPTELLADTLGGGRTQISNLVRDGANGGYQVAIAVPVGSPASAARVRRPGGYALGLTLPPGLIAGALKEQHLPPSWVVTVLDRNGAVAARTIGERESLGQHLAPELLAAIAQAPVGLIHGLRTLKGIPAVMAFARAPRSGFVAVANIPESMFQSSLWAALTRTFLIGSGLLMLGLATAFVYARQISAALRRLAAVETSGDAVPARDFREFDELAQALAESVAKRNEMEAGLRIEKAELRQANQALEARVAQEVAARKEAFLRLAQAQRIQALGQLAGGVAHDFNNLLQVVSGASQLIESQAPENQEVGRLAHVINRAAERGATVTRRLLVFAKQSDLRAEPLEVSAVFEELQAMLVHTLGPSVDIVIAVPSRMPLLFADKGQLETALVNLATNARDAMQPAGGTLTFSAVEEEVAGNIAHPARLKSGRYIRLSISDTGAGMSATVLSRASEPFFTTKSVGKGSGLGLGMVRGFAEQSGGGFSMASDVGHGTTVSIWLPQKKLAAKPLQTAR